jgi:hypothetical protein
MQFWSYPLRYGGLHNIPYGDRLSSSQLLLPVVFQSCESLYSVKTPICLFVCSVENRSVIVTIVFLAQFYMDLQGYMEYLPLNDSETRTKQFKFKLNLWVYLPNMQSTFKDYGQYHGNGCSWHILRVTYSR